MVEISSGMQSWHKVDCWLTPQTNDNSQAYKRPRTVTQAVGILKKQLCGISGGRKPQEHPAAGGFSTSSYEMGGVKG